MLRLTVNKRGDGLSLNVIVLAVLALLILVILSFIVLRGTGTFNTGVSSCDACVSDKNQCDAGYVPVPSTCHIGGASGPQGSYCCTGINPTQ